MTELNLAPYLAVLPNIFFAFIIGIILTPILRKIGLKFGFATKPKHESDPNERGNITKHHKKTTSRLAEFAMVIPLLLLMWSNLDLNIQIFGFVMSIVLISVIGAFDSKYHLSEFVKLFFLFFAGLFLVFTGTIIDVHGIIDLRFMDYTIINPLTGGDLSLLSVFVTLAWIMVIPTALSYVGGVDGLAEGTSAIAIFILLLIGIRNNDAITITIASLSLGGLLGLLPYNFYPAVIFSEHLTYGFLIAVLAIISQAKVTISLLIILIPVIDFVYIASYRVRKYFKEKGSSKFNFRLLLHYLGTGDRNHLHHKLMELGLNAVQISLLQYAAYAILGFIALAVSGLYLTFVILGTVVVIVLIFTYINKLLKLKHNAR